jgi:hypothetical protein
MQTWLKLLGSVEKPLTHPDYQGRWEENYIGFRKTRKPSIRSGDRIFLYAPGGTKSVFALAEAVSDPYNPMAEGHETWNVDIRYLINLQVTSGINIAEITTGQRNLLKSVQRQSHIKLSSEEAELAFHKLQNKARG